MIPRSILWLTILFLIIFDRAFFSFASRVCAASPHPARSRVTSSKIAVSIIMETTRQRHLTSAF
jgi:hypothetical protein